MSGKKAKAIAEKLSTGIWTHDYPIRVQEAQALGLSVSTHAERNLSTDELVPSSHSTPPLGGVYSHAVCAARARAWEAAWPEGLIFSHIDE